MAKTAVEWYEELRKVYSESVAKEKLRIATGKTRFKEALESKVDLEVLEAVAPRLIELQPIRLYNFRISDLVWRRVSTNEIAKVVPPFHMDIPAKTIDEAIEIMETQAKRELAQANDNDAHRFGGMSLYGDASDMTYEFIGIKELE